MATEPVPGRPNSLPVVFRIYPDAQGGEVIALFPTEPADVAKPGPCMSYMRVGQHSAADWQVVLRTTKPCPTKASAPLAKELRDLGYRLVPYRRITGAHHDARRAAWEALRAAHGRPPACAWCGEEPQHYLLAGRSVNGADILHEPVRVCYGCGRDPGHGWRPSLLPGHADDSRSACPLCSPAARLATPEVPAA